MSSNPFLYRYEELERALEKTEEMAEAFWAKCVDKWKDIPDKLGMTLSLCKQDKNYITKIKKLLTNSESTSRKVGQTRQGPER